MVTLLAWIAHKLVSSNNPTRYDSEASWRAKTALDWNLKSDLNCWATSLTNLWKGNFLIKSSVLFWYLLISLKATVPGLYLWGFLIPLLTGADFLAALFPTYFLGAFPAGVVCFLAVCLVLAIFYFQIKTKFFLYFLKEYLFSDSII